MFWYSADVSTMGAGNAGFEEERTRGEANEQGRNAKSAGEPRRSGIGAGRKPDGVMEMFHRSSSPPKPQGDISRPFEGQETSAKLDESDQARRIKKWPTAGTAATRRPSLAGILTTLFTLLCSDPCNAISERIQPFEPATADESTHWIRLLKLEAASGLKIKSAKLQLLDVTVFMTRIESAACAQGVCPTFFKYQMDKEFEFIIPCKDELTGLDIRRQDANGKYVLSIALVTGDNLTTTVVPTSLGPLITTANGNLP